MPVPLGLGVEAVTTVGALKTRIAPMKTIFDFGAVGDGVTDDTAAFQAMADYQLSNPGLIYVPGLPFSYLITRTITFVGSGFGMIGSGGGQNESADSQIPTVITWGGSTSGIMFDFGDGTNSYNGPNIQNICLDGNQGNTVSSVTGIRAQRMVSAFLSNVNVKNVGLGYDWQAHSFAGLFTFCTAYRTSGVGGWRFDNANHATTMLHCKHWGGSALAAPNPTTGPVSVLIGIGGNSSQFTALGCDFEAYNVRGNIVMGKVSSFFIGGLYSEAHSSDNIGVIQLGEASSGQNVQGGLISGCVFTGNSGGTYAIQITNAQGIEITGNQAGGFTSGFINNANFNNTNSDWDAAHNLLGALTEVSGTVPTFGRRGVSAGSAAYTTLTDGASIAVNMNAGTNFTVTLGGNRAFQNPTNGWIGKTGYIRVVQGGAGSFTPTFAGNWKFPGAVVPTFSAAVGAVDIMTYVQQAASGEIDVIGFAADLS